MTELQKWVWDSLSSNQQADFMAEYKKCTELANQVIFDEFDLQEVEEAKKKIGEFIAVFGDAIVPPKIEKTFKNVPGDGIETAFKYELDSDGGSDEGQMCITYGGNNLPEMIVNKAVATLKISAIINHFFGGMVSDEELKSTNQIFVIRCTNDGQLMIDRADTRDDRLLMFRIKEVAEEFLSYKENKRLVYDYFMSNIQY